MNELLLDLWKIPFVLACISFGEWTVHRYLLHGAWVYRHVRFLSWIYRWHHIEHHAQERNDLRPHVDLRPWDYFLVLPFMIVALVRWLQFDQIGGLTSLIAQVTGCTLHMLLWNSTHRAIHGLEPNNWSTRLPWYGFIRRHHEGHHQDPRKNLNIVFPLADYLLGTVYRPKSAVNS